MEKIIQLGAILTIVITISTVVINMIIFFSNYRKKTNIKEKSYLSQNARGNIRLMLGNGISDEERNELFKKYVN